MKKNYIEPNILLVRLAAKDVLTMSGDNDAPFIGGGKDPEIDNGWSGYH